MYDNGNRLKFEFDAWFDGFHERRNNALMSPDIRNERRQIDALCLIADAIAMLAKVIQERPVQGE